MSFTSVSSFEGFLYLFKHAKQVSHLVYIIKFLNNYGDSCSFIGSEQKDFQCTSRILMRVWKRVTHKLVGLCSAFYRAWYAFTWRAKSPGYAIYSVSKSKVNKDDFDSHFVIYMVKSSFYTDV